MTGGIMRRLPVKYADGSIDLIEIEGIFYLEAQGEDTLIRTKQKKAYKSIQRLGELAKKLPAPVFVRCHREFIVNLKESTGRTLVYKFHWELGSGHGYVF